MTGEVIPFGKYKGSSVENVATRDPQYLQWLMSQSWFTEKFGHLINITVNNFGVASNDTPEHNEMQARFIDTDMCLRVCAALGFVTNPYILRLLAVAHNLRRMENYAERRTYWEDERVLWEDRYHCDPEAKFECGMDVVIDFRLPHMDCEHPRHRLIGVECKPSVGDDFPAVLRQMDAQARNMKLRNAWCDLRVLYIGEYVGTSVPKDRFVKMFESSGITVIFEDELAG